MSDYHVKVHSANADERIRKLSFFLSDLRPFWPIPTRLFIGWMREQFETEGAFGGRRWPPLAPATLAIKAALGLRLQILQATGQAKQAASNPIRIARHDSLTLIIDDAGEHHGPVLHFHQDPPDGARYPPRPLIFGDPLPARAAAELRAGAEGYVRDLLARI